MEINKILLKLREEPEVILKEEPYVIYPQLQHGNPLDTNPEGKTGVFYVVVADGTEHLWVNHSRTEDLKPSTTLADPAPLSSADETPYVDLSAGLGKWKETRSKPGGYIL